MKNLITLILISIGVLEVFAQRDGVGIGTNELTSKYAILEVKSNQKGILIPRLTTGDREGIEPDFSTEEEGLMVYDKDENAFYYYTGSQWVRLVEENYQNYPTVDFGAGPIPRGGIIMWSGTEAPPGWALCDGSEGTPDLSGRFIVGYDPANTDYDDPGTRSAVVNGAPGETGGLDFVELKEEEMPNHNHAKGTISASMNAGGQHKHQILTRLSGGDGDTRIARGRQGDTAPYYTGSEPGSPSIGPDGQHTHAITISGNTAYAGGDYLGKTQSHENRPPYYVLAFIMKM